MKKTPWILLAGGLIVLAAAPGACGGGGTTTTTATGSAGTGGATSSSSSSTSKTTTTTTATTSSVSSTGVVTGTGGAGGSMGCMGLLTPGTCVTCLETSCCTELAACNDDPAGNCFDCITQNETDPTVCMAAGTTALIDAFNACLMGSCSDTCIAKSACNPVTNEGCDQPGDTCDLGSAGVFECFAPPNDGMLCGACSNSTPGPFCAVGLHCDEDMNGGKCARYCCDDGDCGTGKCDKSTVPENVGICLASPADAGINPACDPPAVAPSNGSCFVLPGAPDGGAPDAGSGDAGSGDAGSGDGGTVDGGAGDAGAVDGGDAG